MAIYSYSKLDSFENCPRKYWYGYIEKPDIVRVINIEGFLGNRVHEALEELYKCHLNSRLMSEEDLLAWYKVAWNKAWNENIRVVNKNITVAEYREIGLESLKAYYLRYHPFDQSRTLQLEQLVTFNLDWDGKYRVRGYIDRLSQRQDRTYEIHDYKTSRIVPTQADADKDRQLALYHIGLQSMWNDVHDVDLIWHYLRFDKEIISHRTPEQLDEVKQQCIGVIDDIESRGRDEANFPTNPSYLCDWCDFREICPAMRHQAQVEELPQEQFKADDGVKLVDSLVALRDQRLNLKHDVDTLEEEERAIKERIIQFAEQQGLESVTGSLYNVNISYDHKIEYPKSADENRQAFEETLRQAGLWEQTSGIDRSKLKAFWEQKNSLPPSVRKSLEPFLTETTEPTARLHKRRDRS